MVGQNRYGRVVIVVFDGIIDEELLIERGRYLFLVCSASSIDIIHRLTHQVMIDSVTHLMGYCGLIIYKSLIVQKYE